MVNVVNLLSFKTYLNIIFEFSDLNKLPQFKKGCTLGYLGHQIEQDATFGRMKKKKGGGI